MSDIAIKEKPSQEEIKKKKEFTFKMMDRGGEVMDVPIPENEEGKKNFAPFIFVDGATKLPTIDYPITAVAKIAKMVEGHGGNKWMAKELGVTEEKVAEWVKAGLDPKTQWRKRIPITNGDVVDPTRQNPNGVRMVAAHPHPETGGPIFVPDFTHGENLYRQVLNANLRFDTRMDIWKRNYEENKPFTRGVKDLRGSWKGKPVILVGSSPSLKKNVHLLEELQKLKHRKDVKIVSCNRILNHLDPEIIDWLMCMDFMGRRDWFEGFDCNKTELISYIFGSSMVKEYWDEKNIRWFNSHVIQGGLPMEADHDDLGFMVYGSSISMAMLWFAFFYLEANPIIICGFDHAYPGMEVYPDEPMKFNKVPGDLMFLEDINGNVIPTGRHLVNERVCNDLATLFIRKARRRVINCTEGGILKNNDRMPLAEAIERFVKNREDPNDEFFENLYRRTMLHLKGASQLRLG